MQALQTEEQPARVTCPCHTYTAFPTQDLAADILSLYARTSWLQQGTGEWAPGCGQPEQLGGAPECPGRGPEAA